MYVDPINDIFGGWRNVPLPRRGSCRRGTCHAVTPITWCDDLQGRRMVGALNDNESILMVTAVAIMTLGISPFKSAVTLRGRAILRWHKFLSAQA